VNTPETQQADCDYATGKIVEAVANSRYASDTIVIITEDDVQDGPDSVDSHRAPAFVVGPYVKKGAIVSTPYNQVSALRTIEDLLGTQHINLNTAYQRPMADVFDVNASGTWSYTATASTYLPPALMAGLALPAGEKVRYAAGPFLKSKHNAAYWEKATAGMDFSEADEVDPFKFNQILWKGLTSNKPFKVKDASKAPAQVKAVSLK
jgi:hypothetical protein